jgi:hypothetical protein
MCLKQCIVMNRKFQEIAYFFSLQSAETEFKGYMSLGKRALYF